MLYHTNTNGPSESGFKVGFKKAVLEASHNGTNEVIFLVHTLKMLRDGVCEKVLGKTFVESLAKTKAAKAGAVAIRLETERIKKTHRPAVIFAPYVSSKLLSKAIADPRAIDIVYVPWAPQELDTYVATNPTSVQI